MSEQVDRVCLHVDEAMARDLVREMAAVDVRQCPTVLGLVLTICVLRMPEDQRSGAWERLEGELRR